MILNQEEPMASTPKSKPAPAEEPTVDFMADAPPERPYSEAITSEHREMLSANGVIVPEGGAKPE